MESNRRTTVPVHLSRYLRNSLRMPCRKIQDYLLTIHRLKISVGEIVELLHDMRQATHKVVEELKKQAQANPILHADETGWRQNGRNGYIWGIWGFFTPGKEAVRCYEYDASLGQAVPARFLDGKCHGHLVTDFYSGFAKKRRNSQHGRHKDTDGTGKLVRDMARAGLEPPRPMLDAAPWPQPSSRSQGLD